MDGAGLYNQRNLGAVPRLLIVPYVVAQTVGKGAADHQRDRRPEERRAQVGAGVVGVRCRSGGRGRGVGVGSGVAVGAGVGVAVGAGVGVGVGVAVAVGSGVRVGVGIDAAVGAAVGAGVAVGVGSGSHAINADSISVMQITINAVFRFPLINFTSGC